MAEQSQLPVVDRHGRLKGTLGLANFLGFLLQVGIQRLDGLLNNFQPCQNEIRQIALIRRRAEKCSSTPRRCLPATTLTDRTVAKILRGVNLMYSRPPNFVAGMRQHGYAGDVSTL